MPPMTFAADELNLLIPHPIELALAVHFMVGLVVFVGATVLLFQRRLPGLAYAATLLVLLLPLLGLVLALVLVFAARRPHSQVASPLALGPDAERIVRERMATDGVPFDVALDRVVRDSAQGRTSTPA